MTKDENEFGKLIRKLRQDMEISQGKFAKKLDITPTYISKIERGEFPPPSEKIIKLMAKILNYNIDKLLAYADKVDSELLSIIKSEPKLYAGILRRRANKK